MKKNEVKCADCDYLIWKSDVDGKQLTNIDDKPKRVGYWFCDNLGKKIVDINFPDCTTPKPTDKEIKRDTLGEAIEKSFKRSTASHKISYWGGFISGMNHVNNFSQSVKLKEQADEIERLNITIRNWGEGIRLLAEDKKTLSSLLSEAVEGLERIESWKDAYPEDVFTPLVFNDYKTMCGNAGYSVDRVSAHVMRTSTKAYSGIATELLEKLKHTKENDK